MRLRTRLQITLTVAMAVVAGVCLAIGLVSLRAERLQSALADAREIGRDLASLQALTLEFTLSGGERPVQQWHARLERLRATAERARADPTHGHPALQQLRERIADLEDTYTVLEDTRAASDTSFDQRRLGLLVDHLNAQAQELVELRHEWERDLAGAERDDARLLQVIVPAGLLLMLAAILLLAWTVSRHVLAPLARLQEVARAIQGGDLTARVRSGRDDELGLASRAVDDMAQSLVDQSAALAQSNEDLARFASVVSHDLQEPLRMVHSFGLLLRERHQDRLDPEALEFLDFMIDGGQRGQAMVRGLLKLARLDNHGRPPVRVALQAVLDDALAQSRLSLEASGARITADPLPELTGDRIQLGQLFANLIGNAVKFRRAEPPTLHIGVQRGPGLWCLSFRDNGIGIEPAGQDRIFGMFQRLDPRHGPPGDGIGLAICQRVAERHGGSIRVESRPGAGSTFHVTLADHGPALGRPAA